MAGRAILQLVNGKQIREQNWQSTLSRGSNATQETLAHHIGAVETNGSLMPPSPRFLTQLGVVEPTSLGFVDKTIKLNGNGDDVHAPGTVFKRREAVGYPFGEGTSKSRSPLPLPKQMTAETSPRREDNAVAMQKGKFVESSSTSLATTTTKAVEMDWQSLPPWVNVGSSSRRSASQHDDINLEFALTCSSTGSLLETGKLLRANAERPKPKSSLTINLDDIDDAKVKRLKLDDSSNPCAPQLATKLFGTILETSTVQAAPNRRGDKETMPIVIDESDGEADWPTTYAWLRRWLHNGGKVGKKPEGVGPPNDDRRPSIAAMALMGRALLSGYEKPCEVEKRGAVIVWKI